MREIQDETWEKTKKKPQRDERTKVPAFKSKNPILISHEKPNGNDKPLKEMRSF